MISSYLTYVQHRDTHLHRILCGREQLVYYNVILHCGTVIIIIIIISYNIYGATITGFYDGTLK